MSKPSIRMKINLKQNLSRISLFLLLTATLASPTVSNAAWQLAWSDEFAQADGTSPDSAKWGFDIGGGYGNNELESCTSRTNNARIINGQLVIEAKQENFTGPDNIPRNYTLARMLTKGKWSWTYGRMEARIKIPRGQGDCRTPRRDGGGDEMAPAAHLRKAARPFAHGSSLVNQQG